VLRISPLCQKKACCPGCQAQDIHMSENWIPRSKRWTIEQRKQKEIDARNSRALSRMFWNNLNETRKQIEKEIETKKLARIKLLE
jgi:hypothetical protein